MKRKYALILTIVGLLVVNGLVGQASAQGPNATQKTSSRMLYHNGPVRTYVQEVYFIFYGCWGAPSCTSIEGDPMTMLIPQIFASTIGNTPYMAINNTYTNSSGQPASGAIVYAGSVVDNSYRHGVELTKADIEAILNDHIGDPGGQGDLPADGQGIYVIVASADIASNDTGFCIPGARPFHSYYSLFGTPVPYIFLGNPNRCRTVAGGQYFTTDANGYVTPNGNFAGDAMTLNLAHALNGVLTDPFDTGWYDRYGLENADKCTGTFGQTYTTANGAKANFSRSGYDFLIEQNWVNDRKGRCALFQ